METFLKKVIDVKKGRECFVKKKHERVAFLDIDEVGWLPRP
jgi:hypothetical protein